MALAASAPSAAIDVSAAPATQLVTSAPATATAGALVPVTVTAEDQFGNADPSYTGTVGVTSTDLQALLPAAHAYTAGDNGAHTFDVTLKTAGSSTVTASDGSRRRRAGAITVSHAAASQFVLTGTPGSLAAGGTGSVTVAAQDGYGNVDPTFTGTVTFSSDDPLASLPSSYAFTAVRLRAPTPSRTRTRSRRRGRKRSRRHRGASRARAPGSRSPRARPRHSRSARPAR